MPRVLVLYYSSYGHIEAMAYAQAEEQAHSRCAGDGEARARNLPGGSRAVCGI